MGIYHNTRLVWKKITVFDSIEGYTNYIMTPLRPIHTAALTSVVNFNLTICVTF